MAIERKTVRRGIWRRETASATTWQDLEELAKESGWDKTIEQRVREQLAHAISVATRVLGEANLEIRDGLYEKTATGKFKWLGPRGKKLKLRNGSFHLWPYFLQVEPLTAEYFAINLIHNARGLLDTIEKARDKWEVASMGLFYADALSKFYLQSSGIAEKAEAAVATATKARKAREERASITNFARNLIQTEFLKLPRNSVDTKNAMAAARAISSAVNAALARRPVRKLKDQTIQRHIQRMGLLRE